MSAALAVITINFDPLLHLGALTIRWQTVGVTAALLIALGVAVLMLPADERWQSLARAGRPPARSRAEVPPRFPDAPSMEPMVAAPAAAPAGRPLRLDDMVLIVVGIVPGAVVGGRLLYGLDFLDAYAAAPASLFDPAVGGLSLLGALLGGLASAAYIGHLLGAPLRRWVDAATVPLLLVLGLGKLAQFLGGSGQGLPFDGPWAVAFGGSGPWVSLDPALPSHPSQIYEALWLLLAIPIVLRLRGTPRSPGHLFVVGLSWVLLGRLLVGFTWRDDPFIGPLNAEQAVALLALVVILAGAFLPPRSATAPGTSGRGVSLPQGEQSD